MRLTDAELARLDEWDYIAENAKRHRDDFDGFYCAACHVSLLVESEYDPVPLCSDCQWKAVDSMAAELRDRRAQDLTASEREALRWLRDGRVYPHGNGEMRDRALALIDKLLGGKP